jgi:surfactin family lipopeptide synthetase C
MDWWPNLDKQNTTTEAPNKNIESIYPLSPLQEGLLFHALLTPESAVYFEQVSCKLLRLAEPLKFRQAWKMVVDRHAPLRTCFYTKNRRRPLQVVRLECELPWVEEDWSGMAAAEREALLAERMQADRERGFDFTKAPLMRCALIHLGEVEYQFLWSHHHLILDGWSGGLIVKEVFENYAALCAGPPRRLPLPKPFQNYVTWLSQRDAAQDELYWRAALKGFTAATRIGSNVTVCAAEAEYAERELIISEELTSALEMLTREHRLTLNCLVQGAWAVVLSRLSGDADVVFGSTVSGRPPELPGVEAMIGVFINALPVRVRVPAEGELLPWLTQLMADQVEREQHGHSSLVNIQGWSEVHPGTPLFESLIIFENYPLREAEGGLAIDDLRSFRRSNFPLTLVVMPEARLQLAFSFDTGRLSAAEVERLLGYLDVVLKQFAAGIAGTLSDLTLVSSEDRERIAQWNRTAAEYEPEVCLQDAVAVWARKTPDAVALTFEGHSLTYRALDRRANQVARFLQERGVGPETLVGVCLERSLKMVIALLGILKAGGAYLPLDPAYPAERLSFMIEDAGVPVIVTDVATEQRLPTQWAQIVLMDADAREIYECDETPLPKVASADHLAYVIYTSGSTGQPKGVQVTHRGLSNLAVAQQRMFGPLQGGHVLQFASLNFDASIWEIVMALASGATLHLATAESLMPGPALARLLEQQEITHATLPPSALGLLPEVVLPALRTLIVAGESCSPKLIARWSKGRRFVNAYGPTETTVCATAWVCEKGEQSPPIGSPLPNTQAYPLGPMSELLPTGIAGELHLGGVNLARGYLNRPALTAERFVPDAFSEVAGARLYNAGDLAAWREDGALLFFGRGDHQVKIRGHRVELQEVEAALAQGPGVKECAVAARADADGTSSSLAAYVVKKAGGELDAGALRRHLRSRLPEYMVPGSFVPVEALPLLPNGKVDRKALAGLEKSADLRETRAFRPPRDLYEQKLVAIWGEVLGVHPIGVEDDFFLAGGHSLLAVRLMAWIEQEFGQQMPIATLFKGPTIAQLAAILRQGEQTPMWASLVPVQAMGTMRPLFFVPGGGGNVVYLYTLAHQLGLDRPFYGLQAHGLDGRSAPHGSIEEMAAAYLKEVLAAQPTGPYLLGGHSSGSWVAFEMARQLRDRGHEVAMIAVIDTPAPIPETRTVDVDVDEARFLSKIVRLIERWAGQDLGVSYEELQPLTRPERMEYLQERLKITDILPPQAGRDQVRGLLQVFEASTRNCVQYHPQGGYDGPILLLRAGDLHVEDEGIQINPVKDDETWGWGQLARQVKMCLIPGDHVTMMAEPHVRHLAEELACGMQAVEMELQSYV